VSVRQSPHGGLDRAARPRWWAQGSLPGDQGRPGRGAPAATTEWLAAWPAPPELGPFPPDGADGDALRLVLLVHLGVDWEVWGGTRRRRYWTALAERVRGACYGSRSVADWWERCATRLSSTPRNAAERAELAELLRGGNDRAVLAVLYRNAATLALYCQVLSDARRQTWEHTAAGVVR
jgi:hypothetical protein